jgi:hypothetical protein
MILYHPWLPDLDQTLNDAPEIAMGYLETTAQAYPYSETANRRRHPVR